MAAQPPLPPLPLQLHSSISAKKAIQEFILVGELLDFKYYKYNTQWGTS